MQPYINQRNDLFTKSKNCHGFGPKMPIFPIFFFFLGNIGHENVFYDIPENKNDFLGYKKKEVQTVEKLTFFKRG